MKQWGDDDASFERMERGQSMSQKKPQKPPPNITSVQKKLQELSQVNSDHINANQIENALKKPENFTSLDVEKLQKQYNTQDDPKLEKIRLRLHYLMLQQSQTQQAIEERRQMEAERKKRQEEEELQKEKEEKEQYLTAVDTPRGKERRSIFSVKKKQTTRAEFKPGSGKQ